MWLISEPCNTILSGHVQFLSSTADLRHWAVIDNIQRGVCFATTIVWIIVKTPAVEVGRTQPLPYQEPIQQSPLMVWQGSTACQVDRW